ncbi:MAG: alpha/beta fold hydrolase [Lautropia sp.]
MSNLTFPWGNLHYVAQGRGSPLLLIPGRGLDHTSWDAQLPAYVDHFRVITFDPRGVGRSSATREPYGVVDLADDAARLLESLGIGAAHVAGFSLGGMTAIHLARERRFRMLSLALHSTVDRAYPHLRMRQALSLMLIELDDANAWATFSAFTAFGAEFLNANEGIVEAEVSRRRKRWEAMTSAQKAGVAAQIRAAMTHDVVEAPLGDVAVPTLVTVGSSDDVTRPEYAERMAAEIPGAELVVFPGAPHRVATFMPEVFNEKTLRFHLKHDQPETVRLEPGERS